MNTNIKIGPFLDKDIRSVAILHHKCINLGFLSQLGLRFLYYLYKSIDECEDTCLIIIYNKDVVIGFITGTTSGLRSVYIHLLKNYLIKALLALTPHLFNFIKLKKILEVFIYANQYTKSHHPDAELLSLAIDKKHRGSGVAKELFEELVLIFQNKGIKKFKIIVGEELDIAHTFYKKMGAIEIDSVDVHKGSGSIVYQIKI